MAIDHSSDRNLCFGGSIGYVLGIFGPSKAIFNFFWPFFMFSMHNLGHFVGYLVVLDHFHNFYIDFP